MNIVSASSIVLQDIMCLTPIFDSTLNVPILLFLIKSTISLTETAEFWHYKFVAILCGTSTNKDMKIPD